MNRHVPSPRGPLPFQPRFASALALSLLGLCAPACETTGTDEEAIDETAEAQAPVFLAGRAGIERTPEDVELVFESKVVETDDREIVKSQTRGEITVDQRDRVARPYRFVDEATVYSEEAWSSGGPGKTTERGYRVWRRANATPLVVDPKTEGPPKINANVEKFVAAAEPDEVLYLDLKLRNFPEWNVPLAPSATDLADEDVKALTARRERAMKEREALFGRLSAGVEDEVKALGGRVFARHVKAGWLGVNLPRKSFDVLAKRTDLARIDGPYGKSGGPAWNLGSGRQDQYLDADRFLAAGYTGEEPNPARHGYNDIIIGMNEPGGFEEDACAFKDGPACTGASRIAGKYRCDFTTCSDASDPAHCGYCQAVSTLETNTSSDSHGTATTSVAIGDYTDGQGNGKGLNDGAFTTAACASNANCPSGICENGLCAHTTAWENANTGMAPEAKAMLFGILPGNNNLKQAAFTDMFSDTIDRNLDISSNSWGWGDLNCDLESSSALEDTIETAYDDGVLVVFSAGNEDGDDATTCQIRDPADTPKVLTVNAYDAGTNNCATTPSTRCLLDKVNCPDSMGNPRGCSAKGGADVQVAGHGTISGAVSIVDVVAPNNIGGVTYPSSGTGSDGKAGGGFVGTSAAAPHVSGLAALVKSWYLDNGQSWVNSPGRLHTIMLAMGDRHFSSDPTSATTWTTQIAATPDDWYGVGRARLRLLENGGGLGNWANHFTTYTFTGQGNVTYYPFGKGPLPSGIELMKCVAMQAEDMSGKANISEVKLSVYVRPTATGTSCSGAPTYTRISNNYDTKKVAAIQTTFTNRCVEVQLDAENVTAQGVTVHTMCYYAGVNDDESP